MRTIKLLTAALLIGAASLASAQDGHADKACANMVKAKAELMTKELALSPEQAAKVHDILLKNEENVVRGHCEAMDAKAKKADESAYASINELLDGKQKERMKELQASGKLESCGKDGGKGCCAGKKEGASKESAKPKATTLRSADIAH